MVNVYEEIWAYEERLDELEQERKVVEANIHKVDSIEKTHDKDNVWFSPIDSKEYLQRVNEIVNNKIEEMKKQIQQAGDKGDKDE